MESPDELISSFSLRGSLKSKIFTWLCGKWTLSAANQTICWSNLCGRSCKAGKWDVVVLSPPCNTWSRARCRFRTSAGPPPLRNLHWAWGFPWLSGKQKELLDNHNFLMRQCFLTMALCIDFLVDFLLEHPEDLGAMHDELPASIWQLPELHELQRLANAITFAVYQCHFGAETPKPTRFMTTLQAAKASPFQSWPQFDSKRRYLGPLPAACSHRFHVKKLIGKSKTDRGLGDSSFSRLPCRAMQVAGEPPRLSNGGHQLGCSQKC